MAKNKTKTKTETETETETETKSESEYIDVIDRLKTMHRPGIEILLEINLNEAGQSFYEATVNHMIGYYPDESLDGLPVTYAGRTMNFRHDCDLSLVLDEVETYINNLDMILSEHFDCKNLCANYGKFEPCGDDRRCTHFKSKWID